MKKIYLILLTVCFLACTTANAQFAVTTNGGSGLAATYTSLAAAITDLNAATITAPVVITCAAGTEFSPAGGYSITATGTAANTITIAGNGAASSVITAPSPAGVAGVLTDAIFKLIGSDYVTIQGFGMNENAANTTTAAATNNMVEWGVALLYASTTNGAQNNTIQNNSITLNKTYQNTFGIYSNSTHSATSIALGTATTTAGGNSGLKIYSNNISNVNNGIAVVGPTAAADFNTGIDIGGSSNATANTISNYGTTGTFSGYNAVSGTIFGVLIRNSTTLNVSYNNITSPGTNTAGTMRAIYVPAFSVAPTGTFTNTFNNNTISISTGLATGALQGITVETTTGTATSTANINNNNFTNVSYNVASPTGAVTIILDAMAHLNTNINGNTFTNLSVNTTGSVTFISHSFAIPGSLIINGNSIVTAFTKVGAGGTVTLTTTNSLSQTGSINNYTNNNFSNITVSGATGITGFNNTDGGTGSTKTITGNTFNNWTGGTSAINCMNFTYWNGVSSLSNNTITNITGQSSVTGITMGSTSNAATSIAVANNTINNLSSTGTGGAVTGITCSNSSTTININNNGINTLSSTGASAVNGISISGATTTNVFKNKIYDISGSNASSTVNGILISGGTTINAYNNLIGDLRTPAANAANPLVGLNITGGTTVNAYFNTVLLTASSTGALFGSSAVSASTTPSVTLRNNIFVNNSTPVSATGFSVAYRRSTTTLTTYDATSNNNLFYSGTPGVNNLIFFDGTNSDQTLPLYKSRVAARDASSVTENPNFVSTSGASPNFLHINTTIPTQIESGGTPVSGITDDYDADVRNATTPDIGADEFAGIASDLTGPTISYTPLGNTSCLTDRTLSPVTVTDPSGVNITAGTRPRLYFRKATNANTFADNTSATDGWKFVEATGAGGSPFSFTTNYSLLFGGAPVIGDVIQYFVVAQDNATTPNVGINAGSFAAMPSSVALTAAAFPISGTPSSYTITPTGLSGTVNVGAAQTFKSLTELSSATGIFANINANGLSANTTIVLMDPSITETGAVALNTIIASGCSGGTFTLLIKPNTTTTLTGSLASGALIRLNGADNVTIDGSNNGSTSRNLTITNTGTTSPTAIALISLGIGAGAINNTVKNTNISTGISTSVGYGIAIGGSTPGTAGADNDAATIQNNSITVATIPIYANGTAAVSSGGLDNLNIIGNTVNTNSSLANIGIQAGNALTSLISQNNVSVETTAGSQPVGISLETGFVSSTVSRNLISKALTTATGGYGGRGITIGTATASSALTVSNNVIYGVNGSNWSSFGISSSIGIAVGIIGTSSTLTTTTGGVTLYYNSVSMTGSMGTGSTTAITTALYLGSGTSALDIRDNIFSNTQVGTSTTQKNYSIYSAVANTAFTSINYNDYYASNSFNAASAFVGFLTSDRVDIAAWRTASGQDVNSISADPLFTSPTDLRISLGSPAIAAGTPVSVTTDYTGAARSGTAPTMGAYETPIDATGPVITYTTISSTSCSTAPTLTATITDASGVNIASGTRPRLYYKRSTTNNAFVGNTVTDNGWKYVEATGTGGSPFSFTLDYSILFGGAPVAGDIIQYFVVAADLAATPNVSINSGTFVGNTTPTTVDLQTQGVTSISGTINSYTILGTGLSGTVTIGAAGTYPNLTGASGLFNAINTSGLSGNLTVNIVDNSITETGATALNVIASNTGCVAGGPFTLIIKPNTGTTTTLTGAVASGALIKLNGADNVTIDGSNNGSTSRNLTITNTGTTSPAAIALISLGTGAGATNNTVKNTNISTGVSTSIGYGIAIGGSTPGTAGADNDGVTVQNNNITVATIPIYATGTAAVSTGGLDNLNIIGNTVNTNTSLANIGIQAGNALTSLISQNNVSVQTSGSFQPVGISLETGFVSSTVSRNNITKVLTTATGGYGGRGITVGTGTATSALEISNNMVSGVGGSNFSSFTNSSALGIGIGIIGGSGTLTTTTGGVNLYYNSVNMTGNSNYISAVSTTALYVGTGATALDIRDNIFANSMTATTAGSKSYCVYSVAAASAFTNINYNDYYPVTSANATGLVGFIAAADQATLANWRTATTQDINSISGDPKFVSATDAHINSLQASAVDNAGTPIGTITIDIDGQARNAGTPDIGADEFTAGVVVAVGVEYFRGTKVGTGNYLDWKVNCSSDPSVRLILERSADGRDFRSIQDQNVTAARCAQGFNFTDASPLAGINYYRLKTISPDGAFRYSVIVALINKDKGFELISVAPNPVKTNTVLSISTVKAGKMSIAVSDMTGKVVMTQSINVIAGNNPVTMNFATLGAGTYNIKVINADNEVKTTRFVKY